MSLLTNRISSSSSSILFSKNKISDYRFLIKNDRFLFTINNDDGGKKIKTGILLLNMGGPKTLNDVEPFLRELFLDNDIIKLPIQKWLGPFIAKRRTPNLVKKYTEMGGDTLHHWTHCQSKLLIDKLNNLLPKYGPYKYYIGFRYSPPTLADAIKEIEQDKPDHVIAFSQYPQYCCNTTGSSMNQLAKYFQNNNKWPSFHLSFIDRWPMNNGLIDAFYQLILNEMKKFSLNQNNNEENRFNNRILLLFTAHSIPLYSVNVGDSYTMEISSTVMKVMEKFNFRYPYRLVWQSKVGPLQWQSPSTEDVIKGYIKKGYRNIVLIPISFINEHIETLHELDIEYCQELIENISKEFKIEKNSIQIERCPTPNDHNIFIENGLFELIKQHLDNNNNNNNDHHISEQLLLQCPLCEKDVCFNTKNWLYELKQRQKPKY